MNTFLIFIKNPRLGYVKTRLASTTGDSEALRIYHILLEKTRIAALHTDAKRWLWYSDAVEYGDEWNDALFTKSVQSAGDLGQRMAHAFAQAFETGSEKVLIIGSDCPEISADILEQAFAALDRSDLVLGPTPDGGYYLLGMREFRPAIFEGIAWSTEAVLPQTLEKAEQLGLSVATLPVLSDVDFEVDWLAYLERSKAAPEG